MKFQFNLNHIREALIKMVKHHYQTLPYYIWVVACRLSPTGSGNSTLWTHVIFFHCKLYNQRTESQTIEWFYRPRNWQVGVLLIEEALYCNDIVNITIDNDDNKDRFTAGKSSVLLQLIIIYNNEVQSWLTTMMFNHYQLNDTNTMFLLNKIHISKGYIYIYITQLIWRKQIYQ